MKLILVFVSGLLLTGCQVRLFNDASVNDNSETTYSIQNNYFGDEKKPRVSHTKETRVIPKTVVQVHHHKDGSVDYEYEQDGRGNNIYPNFDRRITDDEW